MVIRARKGNPGSYEALEAYLGRPITNRPQCVIVATATLVQRLDPMPEDQGRWSHEPSWLLSKVRVLAEPVWYQRGGKPYPASDRLLGRARLQET